MNALRVTCLVIVVVSTVVGVAVFARGIRAIVQTLRIGRSQGGRWTPVGPRLATLGREVFGHERFQNKPVVKVAHWAVMVSFPCCSSPWSRATGRWSMRRSRCRSSVTSRRWSGPSR